MQEDKKKTEWFHAVDDLGSHEEEWKKKEEMLPFQDEKGEITLPIPSSVVLKEIPEGKMRDLLHVEDTSTARDQLPLSLPPLYMQSITMNFEGESFGKANEEDEQVAAELLSSRLNQTDSSEREEKKCECGLGKNAVSECLPPAFFEPGNLSLIVLGLSLEDFTSEQVTHPLRLQSCGDPGEVTTEFKIYKDELQRETLSIHVPTQNIFLLRKQLKENYARFEKSNFNGR